MEETIQAFYNEISKSSCSLKEVIEILETINQHDPNYEIIITGVITKLKKERQAVEKEYPEMTDIIEELNQKIETCEEKIKPQEEEKVKIIFGKTPAGKVCFLSDLKDIDRERYGSIWKELKRFIDTGYHYDGWIEEFDVLKIKSSSKGKQERIYGYLLPGGIAYIIGASVKKDDWSKGDRDFLKNRIDNIDEDYKKAQIISKEGNIETLLEENQAIFEEIKRIIKPKEKETNITEYEEKREPTPLERLEKLISKMDNQNETVQRIKVMINKLKQDPPQTEEGQAILDEKINQLIKSYKLDIKEEKAKTK